MKQTTLCYYGFFWLGFMLHQRCKGYISDFPALLVEEDLKCPSVCYFRHKLSKLCFTWVKPRMFHKLHHMKEFKVPGQISNLQQLGTSFLFINTWRMMNALDNWKVKSWYSDKNLIQILPPFLPSLWSRIFSILSLFSSSFSFSSSSPSGASMISSESVSPLSSSL